MSASTPPSGASEGPRPGDRPVIVVPCFNEAARLDAGEFLRLAETVDVWLVDDGSGDLTLEKLRAIAASNPERVRALSNGRNLGKAETIRSCLAAACAAGAPSVGFLDADLATPVNEMLALVRTLAGREAAEAVTAARVGLSGRHIHRHATRHYVGRVFSTIASLALDVPYYDTQCGAKVFRNSPALRAALADPFLSRWAFDVELLGRLLAGSPRAAAVAAENLVEYPLDTWNDIAGSKLTLLQAWKTTAQLFLIWRDLNRRRKR